MSPPKVLPQLPGYRGSSISNDCGNVAFTVLYGPPGGTCHVSFEKVELVCGVVSHPPGQLACGPNWSRLHSIGPKYIGRTKIVGKYAQGDVVVARRHPDFPEFYYLEIENVDYKKLTLVIGGVAIVAAGSRHTSCPDMMIAPHEMRQLRASELIG